MKTSLNKNDLKIATVFSNLFREHYAKSLERNAGGFELYCADPTTEQPFFKCKVWGEAYENLADKDKYTEFVTNLTGYFIFAFKSHFNLI